MSESIFRIPSETKVIAFDWDMTLVDSHGKLVQNKAIAHEFGNPLSEDDVRRLWNESTGFPDLMARLTHNANFDDIMAVVKRDYNNPAYEKKPFVFAEPTVARLRKLGYTTALISSVQHELLEADAAHVGFGLTVFDYVQAQDDWKYKKPDPRVFERLFEQFSIAPAQLLYVGDEAKDYAAATSAGAAFVGVETGMLVGSDFDALGAAHIPTIAEIK